MAKQFKDETNNRAARIARRHMIAEKTGKCSYCPPHDGENRRHRPRDDRYKNHRENLMDLGA